MTLKSMGFEKRTQKVFERLLFLNIIVLLLYKYIAIKTLNVLSVSQQ